MAFLSCEEKTYGSLRLTYLTTGSTEKKNSADSGHTEKTEERGQKMKDKLEGKIKKILNEVSSSDKIVFVRWGWLQI